YRLRAEFRLRREDQKRYYAIFAPVDNRTPILLYGLPNDSERINAQMPVLRERWESPPPRNRKVLNCGEGQTTGERGWGIEATGEPRRGAGSVR
ncbi:hypothetical protein RA276_28675, partial [Pseudomonas syringae pv. tagetis]